MRIAFALPAAVTALIGLGWWWLGMPVAMPLSPIALGEKLYCISYAPFREGQTPLDTTTRISAAQIDEDLARLAKVTDCVRTYSTDLGLDQVAEIARRHGLKVMQGLWLSSNAARNRTEVAAAIGLANQHPDVIRAVIVGNEVLLRGEMSSTDLANTIRGVRAQVRVPVTYADVWEFWLRNRDLAAVADFVTIHILPYWEDFPISAQQSADHVRSIRNKVAAEFPGKEIVIGEVGWPSAGRMRESALPSPSNQARVLHEVVALGKHEGWRVNVIEAFDQPWKRHLEGTVGGHWGLFNAQSREMKFEWGRPVSDHPYWRLQALAGIALALMVFLAAALGGGKAVQPASGTVWTSAAVVAAVTGLLAPWAIEKALVESLGIGGALRSGTLATLAVLGPILVAAALSRGITLPAFARTLGPADRAVRLCLRFALGLTFIVLTVIAIQVALGLVFDPRYRDFPFAALTSATVPFVVLSVIGAREGGARGSAETIAGVLLAGSAIYIAFNESFSNWQSLWLCAAVAMLAFTLYRSRDAQGSG